MRDLLSLLVFVSRFSDFAPKWSGKGPSGVTMGDKYSQTPYGDFWTFGHFCFDKRNHGNGDGPKKRFLV